MENEDKLLIAKTMDKVNISKTRNKILNTEFLTLYQKDLVKRELNKIKFKTYFFFGGYEGAEGEALIIYPEKLGLDITKKNIENIIKVVKINLPKELRGKYTHRDYLGAVMQAGLSRNRIGDIIVHEDKAYIIVLSENANYIVDFLKGISKFAKSKIDIVNYTEIKIKEAEFEELKISVSSMRLDSIISEIVKVSRSKAEILLSEEKIFVNAKYETKGAKLLKENDILAIRGKGKFIIGQIICENRKGRTVISVKKYK